MKSALIAVLAVALLVCAVAHVLNVMGSGATERRVGMELADARSVLGSTQAELLQERTRSTVAASVPSVASLAPPRCAEDYMAMLVSLRAGLLATAWNCLHEDWQKVALPWYQRYSSQSTPSGTGYQRLGAISYGEHWIVAFVLEGRGEPVPVVLELRGKQIVRVGG